mmetsp:Transcript_15444/g.22026  ORF Transcript_15444/g.22026 Transcript_15444/m.22026 type:complete len:517 (-) Transcript_15444:63-1613(-)
MPHQSLSLLWLLLPLTGIEAFSQTSQSLFCICSNNSHYSSRSNNNYNYYLHSQSHYLRLLQLRQVSEYEYSSFSEYDCKTSIVSRRNNCTKKSNIPSKLFQQGRKTHLGSNLHHKCHYLSFPTDHRNENPIRIRNNPIIMPAPDFPINHFDKPTTSTTTTASTAGPSSTRYQFLQSCLLSPLIFILDLFLQSPKPAQCQEYNHYEHDNDNHHSTPNQNPSTNKIITLSSSSDSTTKHLDPSKYSEPLECVNGSIVAENAVPGAYQQICMGLNERSIKLKSTGEEIKIVQGTSNTNSSNGGGSVSGRTGVALWNSGILLTRVLDSIVQMEGENIFHDKTILELGSGTGLASIAASKLGAHYVISTDGNPEVVQLTRTNFHQNHIGSGSGTVSELQWGLLDASDFYDAANMIIGSDLTYNSGTWRVLAETIEAILKPGGLFLYVTLGHSGFNVSGELNGFLTVVQSGGMMEVLEKNHPNWPFQNINFSTLLRNLMNSKEQEVIQSTGGAKCILIQKKS